MNEITVIVTVWKRNHLDEQLSALLSQSVKPACIWVQQTMNHVDVYKIIQKYESDIIYSQYEQNKGVFGRFETVQKVKTPYVYILDDDIIPGDLYLENALDACQRLEAIISPNGRFLEERGYIKAYVGDDNKFQHSFCFEDTKVDIGNNAWFFKTEWIRFFLQETPLNRFNGEDIHLSATCQLYGKIPTYVLKQIIPCESGNKKRMYSSDEHALHRKKLFVRERQDVIRYFRKKGWLPVVMKKQSLLDIQAVFNEHINKQGIVEHSKSVSVILPVYNGKDYIRESIDSILGQTLSDFELIIIDDASIDGTADLILGYKDCRITYLRNEQNLGIYPSRNIGMRMARGKYIAVMDADDIALIGRLERQFNYMEADTTILATGTSFLFVDSDRKLLHPLHFDEIRLTLLQNNCVLHPSLMIRTDVLRDLCGYNESYCYSADYDLMCRIVLLGKIVNLPDMLMKYRWHPKQVSQLHSYEQQLYANRIRQKYQLEFIRFYLSAQMALLPDAYMLRYPTLGNAIALYLYTRYEKSEAYETKADGLLDSVLTEISGTKEGKSDFDLYSIGCGLIFLLRNGFVDGSENVVLKKIDQSLNWGCLSNEWSIKEDVYTCIHYLCLRLEQSTGLQDICNRQNLICMLDKLDYTDVKEENDILLKDLEKIKKLGLCPVSVDSLFELGPVDEEFTIVIPFRIDSNERECNLDKVLEQLSRLDNVQIILLEADLVVHYHLKSGYANVTYLFEKNDDPIFYRTHYINKLLSVARTRVVGVWDADVIVPETQILDARRIISNEDAALCFPYDGHFCLLPPKSDIKSVNSEFLPTVCHSVGGAFFVDREVYMKIGGENEHFYGWGCEDLERVKRLEILGLHICRTKGSIYHLYHPKGVNSKFGNTDLEINNRQEFLKVCGMEKSELLQYIGTWGHLCMFSS